MGRKVTITGIVLLLLGVSIVLYHSKSVDRNRIADRSLSHFIPSESRFQIGFVGLDDLPEDIRSLSMSRGLLQTRLDQTFRTKIFPLLKMFFSGSTANHPIPAERNLRSIGSRGIVISEDYNGNASGDIVGIFDLDLSDSGSSMRQSDFDSLLKSRVIDTSRRMRNWAVETETNRGVKIYQVTFSQNKNNDGQRKVSFARVHDYFLIGPSNSTLKRTIKRYASSKNSGGNLLYRESIDSSEFRLRYVKKSRMFSVYNFLFESTLMSLNQGLTNILKPGMRAFEEIQADQTKGNLTFYDELMVMNSRSTYSDSIPYDVVETYFKARPSRVKVSKYFPHESVFAGIHQFDSLSKVVKILIDTVPGEFFTKYLAQSKMTESEPLTVKPVTKALKSMVSGLGSEIGYSFIIGSNPVQKLRSSVPVEHSDLIQGLLVVNVTNFSKFKTGLTMLDENSAVTVRKSKTKQNYQFELPSGSVFYMRKDGDYLLVSQRVNNIQSAVKRRKNGSNLNSSTGFRSLRDQTNTKINHLLYMSSRPLAPVLRSNWMMSIPETRRRWIQWVFGYDPYRELSYAIDDLPGNMLVSWNQPNKREIRSQFVSSGDILLPLVALRYTVLDNPKWLQKFDAETLFKRYLKTDIESTERFLISARQ